jgi:DNA-binding transcriptional ArsR family regulator/uncharacterized glyoxalase superfamily protein PhnB
VTAGDNDIVSVLQALAEPTRWRVVELLGTSPLRAGQLADALNVNPPAMSKHLRILLQAGVVTDERPPGDARVRVFTLRPESMTALRARLDQLQAHWDEQLASFKAHVKERMEVPLEPDLAFKVFTEEVDLWWVRGPINHYAAGRLLCKRIEAGIGGRVLEVYDDEVGEALELARITSWEPGRRLSWRSSLDDVHTEISFEACPGGTTVRVVARIPSGGQDRGGTSWVRVVPKWFGAWCTRRDVEPHVVRDLARLALGVSYARPATAARWLSTVFGFQSPDPLPEGEDPLPEGDHGHPWIEFRLGNSSLMLFKTADDATCARHEPWVYVDDVESHFRVAEAGGAKITEPLASPWGLPFYVAEDLEGNSWRFAQARPTMS